MRKEQKTNFIYYWQLAGLIPVVFLTSQCISPFNNPLSRFIGEHAVFVMLGLFVLGMIAVMSHRPYVMLYTWLSCTLLCQFIKDSPRCPFYYAKVNADQNTISLAQFDFQNEHSGKALLVTVNEVEADLVSLLTQKVDNQNSKTIRILRQSYPHYLEINTNADSKKNLLFSKFPIHVLDTFYFRGNPYISSCIQFDSCNGRVQFLNFNMVDETEKHPDSLLNYFVNIADNWTELIRIEEPFMVLGDISSVSWAAELREFRNRLVLNDSRLDLSLIENNKHIFYSGHLRCTKFKQVENGVVGVYHLKPQNMLQMEIRKQPNIPSFSQR